MENDILKNNFETIYKDYKDYESFLDSVKEDTDKQREDFKQRVLTSGESDDALVDALFSLSIKPIQSGEDLRILRDRLINVYDAYKLVLEFPEEIKEEIKVLKKPLQMYRIQNGVQVEIDREKNEIYREEARKIHLQVISNLKNN